MPKKIISALDDNRTKADFTHKNCSKINYFAVDKYATDPRDSHESNDMIPCKYLPLSPICPQSVAFIRKLDTTQVSDKLISSVSVILVEFWGRRRSEARHEQRKMSKCLWRTFCRLESRREDEESW